MEVVTFNNLLIKIFKSHGFEINSSSNYSKYILATKDNINLSIGYSSPNEEITLTKVRNFYRSAKKDNADRLIYVIPTTTYPGTIDKFIEDRKIQLWNRERFERELGRAVMANVEGTVEYGEFSDELNGIPSGKLKEKLEEMEISITDLPGVKPDTVTSSEEIPIMVPFLQVDQETEPVSAKPELSEELLSEPDLENTSISEIPNGIPEEIKEVKIIKPNVTKQKASSMASNIVRGFRFNLELIPYYIFSYTCQFDLNVPGESENSGLIGINGLTSNVEDWSGKIQTVTHLDEEHTKLNVKFPYEKAYSLAKDAIIEINTKSIETKEESESTIIFERKKLRPKSDAINIKSEGIYFLPVWCIEGSNGLMIIDASSGKIIKEDMF